MTDREPVDLREQPECICPVEGPAVEGCPLCDFLGGVEQATREEDRVMRPGLRESIYPVRTPRDAQGVTRTGYQFGEDEAEEEDVKF